MQLRASAAVFALALLVPVTSPAADTYEIDPAHTSVQFSVRHMMISNVRGEFTKVAGKATGDVADPTATTVEATIDAASIDTRNEKRDEHLRGPDFLDAAKFPTITFKSTKVAKAGDGWKLSGDLTLHGVTKPVVLDVTNVTAPTKDPWGNTRIGASATTKIDRQDYGIVFNKTLDGGGVLVGDEIAITIDVEVMKKGGGAK
jgi:polyisoprenoid-binding protein YceI